MSQSGEKKLPPTSVEFGGREWVEEVERFEPGAVARTRAESARRAIEAGGRKLTWRPCEAEHESGAHLPGCRKLYVPLDAEGASAAPYGFVFQLVKTADNTLIWNFIASVSATRTTRTPAPSTNERTSAFMGTIRSNSRPARLRALLSGAVN